MIQCSFRLKGSFLTTGLTLLAVSRYARPGKYPPDLAASISSNKSPKSLSYCDLIDLIATSELVIFV